MSKPNDESRSDLADAIWRSAAPIAPLDIGAMLRVLWHSKLLIFFTILVVTSLAGTYAFRVAAPQYEATATAELQGAATGPAFAIAPRQDATSLNTTIALATSDQVLAATIAQLDLLSDPSINRYLQPTRPLAIRTLRTRLRHLLAGTTEQPPDDDAIHDKAVQNLRAAINATRLPDTYILQISARSSDPAKSKYLADTIAAQFLRAQSDRRAVAQEEAAAWLHSRADTLRAQIEEQELQAAALIATAQLQAGNGLDLLSGAVLSADQNLIAARNTLELLVDAPGNTTARRTAEIAQLQQEISELAANKTRLSAQLAAQSAGQAQLHQIQLEIGATRQIYQNVLGQLHDMRMQQSLKRPDQDLFVPAAKAIYIGPQKVLTIALALLLGTVLGILFVALAHVTRRGAIDALTLQNATGLQVVSQISATAMRKMQTKHLKVGAKEEPSLLHAAFRLQTALALLMGRSPAKVQVYASSLPGEGASKLAILAARGLVQSGKSVVIILADTHAPKSPLHLPSALRSVAEDSWKSGDAPPEWPELGVQVLALPTNQQPVLPTDLASKLEDLRNDFDHVVILPPPALFRPEAKLFARQADAIIYAVRWAKTPLELVVRGLAAVGDETAKPTGLALTGINPRKMRKLSDDPFIGTIQNAQVI